MMTMSESTYRVERARQTELLHKAIEKAMQDTAEQFETPMLNAVIGALLGSIAESLASIADHRTRKGLRQTFDRELTQQVAARVAAGRPNAKTIVIGEGLH